MTMQLAGVIVAAGLVLQTASPQVPLRSGVEVVAVDVQVVAKEGAPIESLSAADFEVKFDGGTRRVASVEFVRYAPTAAEAVSGAGTAPGAPGAAAPRRMFVIAVDEQSLKVGSNQAAIDATKRFIDRLGPNDMVGLQAYPTGTARTDLTTDHASVKKALDQVRALYDRPKVRYNLTGAEVIDIASGDSGALRSVVERECSPTDRDCPTAVQPEAQAIAGMLEVKIDQSLSALRGLIAGLARIPGRKTMVLVSGGLLASDRSSGRVNAASEQRAVGREAAKANVNLYALHLDDQFLDAFTGERPAGAAAASPQRNGRGAEGSSLYRESSMNAMGLEMIARAAGGEVFRVEAGTPDKAMDRILRESSGYYLVGVEPQDKDRDGKEHTISVKVKTKGATVRNRSTVVIPKKAE